MPLSEVGSIVRWLVPLWLMGWAALPLASRVLGRLPDQGLAAGRFLALVLLSLAAFWGASLKALPLQFTPLLFGLGLLSAGSMWLDRDARAQVDLSPRARRGLLLSDAVFLLSYAFFLWVRLRYPEADNLEKPMDAALISAAQRTTYLPFENPWFAGQPFTNYYYFGPLLSALMGRALFTAPWFTYNLAQPAICAFFLSTLWSVGAAACRSRKAGLAVMLLVGLGGHLEPLRQVVESGKAWPIDWWSTSRVIKFTINEYPLFTLTIGDAHGHFYAFAVALLFFGLCFNVVELPVGRRRSATMALCGVVLGAIFLTNTWDTPFYALLLALCARRGQAWHRDWCLPLAGSLLLAPLTALPYVLRFKPQIKGGFLNSGFVFQLYIPNIMGLFLYWGSWLLLGLGAWLLWRAVQKRAGSGAAALRQPTAEERFRLILLVPGLLALCFPFVCYIRGYMFDGNWRHIDTVFKFWLQAWLLLGLGISAEFCVRLREWWPTTTRLPRLAVSVALTVLTVVLCMAPAGVIWTRAFRDATTGTLHPPGLSAMRFLPQYEQDAVVWLMANAKPGESYLEGPMLDRNGTPLGDFEPQLGRLATFSGVPTTVAWPQHCMYSGSGWGDIVERTQGAKRVLGFPFGRTDWAALQKNNATYIFIGERERKELVRGPRGRSIMDQFPAVWGDIPRAQLPLKHPAWRPVMLSTKVE